MAINNMWKLTTHKTPKTYQEIRVSILVKELATYSHITYAESFIDNFNQRVKDIPRTNNFSADLMYKVIQGSSHKNVEVWKMTASNDFKKKVFTLDFIQN